MHKAEFPISLPLTTDGKVLGLSHLKELSCWLVQKEQQAWACRVASVGLLIMCILRQWNQILGAVSWVLIFYHHVKEECLLSK